MLGTFGGALEARQIDASNGRLAADVTGEVEVEEGVLVIRRIHVAMRLIGPDGVRDTVERVHGMYAMRCLCCAINPFALEPTSCEQMRNVVTSRVGRRYTGNPPNP